jgi:hypothetical protein
MNDEFERTWNEPVLAYFGTFEEGPKVTTKNFNQDR